LIDLSVLLILQRKGGEGEKKERKEIEHVLELDSTSKSVSSSSSRISYGTKRRRRNRIERRNCNISKVREERKGKVLNLQSSDRAEGSERTKKVEQSAAGVSPELGQIYCGRNPEACKKGC
jgi:hypothetical protein